MMNQTILTLRQFLLGALFVLLGLPVSAQNKSDEKALFEGALQRIRNGVIVDFKSETINNKGEVLYYTTGSVKLLDRSFRLRFDALDVNFDGERSYTYYDSKNNSYVLFDGKKERIADMNPILILSSWNLYPRKMISSKGGKQVYALSTLDKESSVRRFIVTFEQGRVLPTRIESVSKDGITTVVSITKEQIAHELTRKDFVQRAVDYPTAEVIDLR